MSGKMPPGEMSRFPDCMLCRDTGVVYMPDYPPAYRFCGCVKGKERQAAEPNLCDESNAREAALGIGKP